MQNKGFIKVIAAALFLACVFYLSFSFVTNKVNKDAETYAQGDRAKYLSYLDSISGEKVWLGYTYKQCREKEINLGLDLKGGMNVTMEVSVPDIILALSDYNDNPNFKKALALAKEHQANSQKDFITLFDEAYKEIDPNAQLSTIFSTMELKDKISLSTPNAKVISILRDEVNSAIDNSFNVLRQRIDRFGVVQPNIQKLENSGRILIELPGIKEPERMRKLLQGTANLEFWQTYELSEISQPLIAANDRLRQLNTTKDAKKDSLAATPVVKKNQTAVDSLAAALGKKGQQKENAKAVEDFKKQNPLFGVLNVYIQNGQAMPGPAVGDAQASDTSTVNRLLKLDQIRALFPRDLSLKWSVKPNSEKDQRFQLFAIKVTDRDGRAPLDGSVITNAYSDFAQYSASANVSMSMNAEGSKTWARLTKENIGRSIAIVLDGYVYSSPRVNDEISGGSSQITGNFTIEEAKDLANTLKSGRMPAPVHIIQEDIVGPSLGQESINSGLLSFLVAFILIMLYMIMYYGLIPGLVADAALIINVFLLIGILVSFKGVLTLPGIAGIVLTLGMAVDTNVLIYERAKEELQAGKNPKTAIADGYSHSASAIIDSNLTTILTGIILFIFGTGPIKGFATTLIIGIITSLLTGFVLSRLIYESILKKDNLINGHSFSTKLTEKWFHNTKVKFIENRKIGYTISAVIIVAGTISLFYQGLNQGIDFSGGRNYVIRFDKKVETEEVKKLLTNAFDGQTPSVITIKSEKAGSNENRLRISTNFKIKERSDTIDNEIEARMYKGLKPLLPKGQTEVAFVKSSILSSQKVGPSIADDIKVSSIWAVLLSILGIGLYIFIRFRDFAFSVGAIASLAHDAFVIIAAYSILYKIMPFSLEIDQAFIAAVLTVIGYSVNDTVIIFDRVREFRHLYPHRKAKEVLNDSMNSTLGRTFSTTFTVFLVIIIIFLFGGEVIKGFIFALLIGVVTGVYSTLFVAVPTVYEVIKKKDEKIEKKK